ncbi:hypothetical protein N7461_000125 [Penicillium sp. DV-2018c]|nr:hypothetical protein N7461_000125 [Penicillium sp. DV-2018c]
MTGYSINQPSGRAVTQSSYLPWSSGDDFRLSLKPISAGDRGSIPRGRDFFFTLFFLFWTSGNCRIQRTGHYWGASE